LIKNGARHAVPTDFLRRTSKWHQYLKVQEFDDNRLWEVAVLFHLRDAFRSGDIWLAQSKRYGDLKQVLVPATTAAKRGTIPGGAIEDGGLQLSRLPTQTPNGAADLLFDLYKRVPDTRITDIMLQVDDAIGFTDAFTHLRTGAQPKDRIGLLNVLLSEGLNLGLRKMAEASNSHGFWELMRISRWHIESEAYARALANIVDAQAKLPMAQFWGMGMTASSDGQFFPTTRQGEAMNLINARYGNDPGLKAYTHVSDQFAPFASQTIPATVSETRSYGPVRARTYQQYVGLISALCIVILWFGCTVGFDAFCFERDPRSNTQPIELIDSPRCHLSQISDFCLSVKKIRGGDTSFSSLHLSKKIKVLRRPVEIAGRSRRSVDHKQGLLKAKS
jgi:hypothetical protein